MSKVYLSLDQSLASTGWAVFKDSELVDFGVFQVPKTKPMDVRLMQIQKEVSELYARFEFDEVFFEDIQMQAGNALTYKHLAYVQAALMLWCGNMDIDYDILAPSHWRKVLGGSFGRKRVEQKQHAINLVKDWYDTEVSSDEADAICLGRAGIQEKAAHTVAFGG